MNSGPSEKDKLMHIHINQPSRHSRPTISRRRRGRHGVRDTLLVAVRTRARWLAADRGTSMNQVLVDALVSGLPTREQILTEAGETS